MNTLKYFKRLEANDALRSDKSEGLHSSFPADKMRIKVGALELPNLFGQVKFGDPEDDSITIFSIYALTELNRNVIVDDKVLGFGDTAVVIRRGDEFIERVTHECERRGWGYKIDLVDYVDKTSHQGRMGPFRKYSDLDFQSEYRIAFRSGRPGAITDFYVGDLSDITEICESRLVKSGFRFESAESS